MPQVILPETLSAVRIDIEEAPLSVEEFEKLCAVNPECFLDSAAKASRIDQGREEPLPVDRA